MNTKILMPVVLVGIVVGAVAFFGGMKFQESKQFNERGNRQFQGRFMGGQNGGSNGGMRMNGGVPVTGEIIEKDNDSITVKLEDGSTKIVLLSDNVTVTKSETGSKEDLKTGEKVGVFGTSNSDGSVTAQNVQLNPMFTRFGGRGQGPLPSPTK